MNLPWWMNTTMGRWLAQRVPPVAKTWERNVNRALIDEAHTALVFARAETGVAADRWVGAMSRPEIKAEVEQKLLQAVLNERNALVQLVRLTSGDEAADYIAETIQKMDRGEPLA